VTIFTPALPGTEVVIFPKVFKVRSLLDVAPTTSAVTCHQRQPISEATKTAPHVNLVQFLICEDSADFADKIPTSSFALGTFKYNLVSPSGSVLNPAGGHFGDGEGDNLFIFFFFFFLTGAFFAGAFLETLAFGVGVGLFVAAVAGATDKASPKANASANFLDLITSVGPT
jgi:hypothetical protein